MPVPRSTDPLSDVGAEPPERPDRRGSVTTQLSDASSHAVDLDGHGRVHYLDFGGPADQGGSPPIVLVHGLGGAALNWLRIGPTLASRTRVYALDLPGFGLSHPAGRSGSVTANVDVLDAFVRTVAGGRAVLVGNSMGGLIAMRQAARRPGTVAGLALIDPVLPRPRGARLDRQVAALFAIYLMPVIGPRFLARHRAQTTARSAVLETLALCCVDATLVPEEFIAPAVEQADTRRTADDAFTPRQFDTAFLQAARSVVRLGARRRPYLDMMRRIGGPVVLIHGAKDRLVPVASARAAAAELPAWRYHEIAGAGHVPMIETPDEVVASIDELLAAVERAELAA
jgi:pimeloyl-ACP methyl ester carboxylesterase